MDEKEIPPEFRNLEVENQIIECYKLLLEYNKKAEEINKKKRKQLFIDFAILILWLICFVVTLTNNIAIVFL